MEHRGSRRDRTVALARTRQKFHLHMAHPGTPPDCLCEKAAWYFAKRRALGFCNCRRRRKGSPKMGTGACYGRCKRPAVSLRVAWRRHQHLWMRGVDADDRRAVPEGLS